MTQKESNTKDAKTVPAAWAGEEEEQEILLQCVNRLITACH